MLKSDINPGFFNEYHKRLVDWDYIFNATKFSRTSYLLSPLVYFNKRSCNRISTTIYQNPRDYADIVDMIQHKYFKITGEVENLDVRLEIY